MTTAPPNTHFTRVRSHQTDLNDVMYHGAFLDVFDDARIETFRRLGYTYEEFKREGWMLVIRRIECEFLGPARMDDLLAISVLIEKFTRVTMLVRFECRREDALLAVARTTYAFLGANGRPQAVPERVKASVQSEPFMHPTGLPTT